MVIYISVGLFLCIMDDRWQLEKREAGNAVVHTIKSMIIIKIAESVEATNAVVHNITQDHFLRMRFLLHCSFQLELSAKYCDSC